MVEIEHIYFIIPETEFVPHYDFQKWLIFPPALRGCSITELPDNPKTADMRVKIIFPKEKKINIFK